MLHMFPIFKTKDFILPHPCFKTVSAQIRYVDPKTSVLETLNPQVFIVEVSKSLKVIPYIFVKVNNN